MELLASHLSCKQPVCQDEDRLDLARSEVRVLRLVAGEASVVVVSGLLWWLVELNLFVRRLQSGVV